jgi:hypothetical protein
MAMTKLRALLAGAVIAALGLFAGIALSQQLTSRTLTGNEAWAVGIGGPQGPSLFITTAQSRNSQGVLNTALTSGSLVLTTNTATLVSTAASASLAVTLPSLPFDGEIFEWVNGSGGAFTGATVTTTDGSTLVNNTTFATLGAGSSVEFRYLIATNSWYRIR